VEENNMQEATYGNIQAAQQRQPDIYDEHRKAVAEWQSACKTFAEASMRREQALANMQKITQVMAEQLAGSMSR
jgi:hypothetical protein